MNQSLIDIAHKIGMDKSIAYSSGSRVVQGVAGVLTVLFVATYLTGVEQGFYFTFGSIVALQVFFELGLTGIMIQYVAHEVSHLSLNKDCRFEGEPRYVSRLASLVRFCIKWYTILALVVFLFLIIIGYLFFNKYGDNSTNVSWKVPWFLVCLGTAFKLFQSPLTSIYMGLGYVKEMSEITFYQQLITPISIWIGFVCGLKLYVIGLGYLLSVLIWQLYIQRKGLLIILQNLLREQISERVVYLKEIFPFQWRIALSWISGYFIFQFFNPVLFATEGAVVAGQMGMTLQALNAIQSFSFSWLNTKVPFYSQLIALKDYVTLDSSFNKTLKQMTLVCLFLLTCFYFVIWILNVSLLKIGGNVVADRFLSYIPLLLMMIPVYLQQYVNSWATYLRCHKQEPFLVNSICSGLVSLFCTFVFGHLYGLYGVTISYFCIAVVFFPWGYYIFKNKKAIWHNISYEK
jgi:O-antigen/teichoic acid export membrane protein